MSSMLQENSEHRDPCFSSNTQTATLNVQTKVAESSHFASFVSMFSTV